MCATGKPRTSNASAMREYWQRHVTASCASRDPCSSQSSSCLCVFVPSCSLPVRAFAHFRALPVRSGVHRGPVPALFGLAAALAGLVLDPDGFDVHELTDAQAAE